MRAMPSPQESTMPVSRTSSCFSYSLICSRMMSLISAARICIAVFPPGRRLAGALGHLPRQAGELGSQAPVVDRPADVEHDPTDQLGVELRGGENFLPVRQTPGQLDELVPLDRAERRGRTDRDADAPERLRNPPGGPEPRAGVDHRAQHERAQPGLLERGRRPVELLARRLEGPLLAGEPEHRVRVAPAEAGRHAGAPAPATNSRTNRS